MNALQYLLHETDYLSIKTELNGLKALRLWFVRREDEKLLDVCTFLNSINYFVRLILILIFC